MHPALLNGKPRATLIESFSGEVFVIRPGFKMSFKNVIEAQRFILKKGWEISIEIIKGSSIQRRMMR